MVKRGSTAFGCSAQAVLSHMRKWRRGALQITAAKTVREKNPHPNCSTHVLVFSVCQRSLFVVCKRSYVKNVCKSFRPLSVIVFQFAGSPTLHTSARGSQPPTKSVGRCSRQSVCSQVIPHTRGLSFYSSYHNFVFAADVMCNAVFKEDLGWWISYHAKISLILCSTTLNKLANIFKRFSLLKQKSS